MGENDKNEKKKTVILDVKEYDDYVDRNHLSVPLKVSFEMHGIVKEIQRDIKDFLIKQGENDANFTQAEKERIIIKKQHNECPARILVETGGRLITGSKIIYVFICFLCSIIGAAIIYCSKYLPWGNYEKNN